MSRRTLEQCRSGKDFDEHAKHHPDLEDYRIGHGSHRIVKGPNGRGIYPVHPQELPKHQQRKLVKMFRAIGLPVLAASIPVGLILHLAKVIR